MCCLVKNDQHQRLCMHSNDAKLLVCALFMPLLAFATHIECLAGGLDDELSWTLLGCRQRFVLLCGLLLVMFFFPLFYAVLQTEMWLEGQAQQQESHGSQRM